MGAVKLADSSKLAAQQPLLRYSMTFASPFMTPPSRFAAVCDLNEVRTQGPQNRPVFWRFYSAAIRRIAVNSSSPSSASYSASRSDISDKTSSL